MGKQSAGKRKPSPTGKRENDGTAQVTSNDAPGLPPPPPLVRQKSATSPLHRHDIARPDFGLAEESALKISEKQWSDDCEKVFKELGKLPKQLNLSNLLRVYSEHAQPLPNEDGDGIFAEGLVRLFEALHVDPSTDLVALVLAQQCQSKAMGLFRRPEFIKGMACLGVDSLDGLCGKIPEIRSRLALPQARRDLYMFTFELSLDSPCKVLAVEDACALWPLFLGDCPHIDEWCMWVCTTYKKQISRDLWDMFWVFASEVPADLSTYDDNPDWPVTLDQFVEHLRATRGS